jgi:PIN domain nuclease of toxin-antitoxin system
VWEVAIKRSLGKLETPPDFRATLLGAGALPLPIDLEHAARVEALPLHHRDPFDRLLIAQASQEGATVVTHDSAFGPYGVPTLW